MILGIDPGERRIGIAVADLETRLARPVEVIDSREVDPFQRIAVLVRELEATEIVVGRPVNLAGEEGPAVEAQQAFVSALRAAVDVNVEEYDERMTSVVADRALRDIGTRRDRRKELRDALAAQVMLQGYLDARNPQTR
ncbi:MAG TPA: Holliday junction resolvase RuvX [Actinomycetota bacterium]|nr:Holliday junction resolvase RuvX [Actinomycetota bacterium]